MKHFIFQNDITLEHLIIDAETVAEALCIMTFNSILTDYTYVGCADKILTTNANTNPAVRTKIDQFVKLCKLANLVEQVAALPKAPQIPNNVHNFISGSKFNGVKDPAYKNEQPANDDNAVAVASSDKQHYTRVMALIDIYPVPSVNPDCDYNVAFIDCYINDKELVNKKYACAALNLAIKDRFKHTHSVAINRIVKVKLCGLYHAAVNEMFKVAYTGMKSLDYDSDDNEEVEDVFKGFMNDAIALKHGTFTYDGASNSDRCEQLFSDINGKNV